MAVLTICGPLYSPATHRSASFRGDHGSRSPVLEEGPQTEAASANPVFGREVRCHSRRARAGPLPTRDSLFRIAGPWFQRPDLCGPIRTAGAGEAPPRPSRLSWANSLRKHFGVDPLVDSGGRS